ncbi:MAG: ABC transporter substrate-binding protein [Lautropia sp.]
MTVFRRLASWIGCVVVAANASVAVAQDAAQPTKVRVAYIGSADFSSGFAAKEKGFFQKRGLDVEFVFVPLTSTTLPAALLSKSIEIGGTTATVLLQANDGGLALQAVAGAGVAYKGATNSAVLVRPDLNLKQPADFIGKKIGTPGIGSLFYVLFRNWLMEGGVDPKQVSFIEAGYPQMADLLRKKNVDAVIASDPTISRIVEAGAGTVSAHFTDALPGEVPIIVYCATSDWVKANPAAARAFREAIAEGAAFVAANEAETRTIIGKYIKLAPEVIATMQIPRLRADIPEASMQIMVDMMMRQNLLRKQPVAAELVR